jgi:hypothetical protein
MCRWSHNRIQLGSDIFIITCNCKNVTQNDFFLWGGGLIIYTLYVKFIRCDLLKDLDHHHICSCSLANNISCVICRDIYDLCIKFHVSSYNSSLVITAKLKAEDNICTTVMLLLYILQKNQLNKLMMMFFWVVMPCGLTGPTSPHGITIQKNIIIFTAMRTLDLTYLNKRCIFFYLL